MATSTPTASAATVSTTAAPMTGQVVDDLNDPNYINWLKVNRALHCTTDVLRDVSETEMKSFHTSLLNKHGNTPCSKPCTHKDIKHHGKLSSWSIACPSNPKVCSQWLTDIVTGRAKKSTRLTWSNSDLSQWQTQPWQIAKIYMERQDMASVSPTNTDPAGILQLLSNFKSFGQKMDMIKVEAVRSMQNTLAYSTDMKVTGRDLKTLIQTLINLLEDPLHLLNHPEAKQAVTDIRKIEAETVEVNSAAFLKQGCNVWKQHIAGLTEDNKKEIIKLIRSNKALAAQLETLLTALEGRVEAVEGRVEAVEGRVEAVETQGTAQGKQLRDQCQQLGDHAQQATALEGCVEALETQGEQLGDILSAAPLKQIKYVFDKQSKDMVEYLPEEIRSSQVYPMEMLALCWVLQQDTCRVKSLDFQADMLLVHKMQLEAHNRQLEAPESVGPPLDSDLLKQLCGALKNNRLIQKINLDYTETLCDEEAGRLLGAALASMPRMEILRISRCSVSAGAFRHIAEGLCKGCPKMKELELDYNTGLLCDEEAGRLLGAALASMPEMEILHISECSVSAGAFCHIAEGLCKGCPKMKELDSSSEELQESEQSVRKLLTSLPQLVINVRKAQQPPQWLDQLETDFTMRIDRRIF